MYCRSLHATLAVASCAHRYKMAKEAGKGVQGSLEHCFECPVGKKVTKNPECFINRDWEQLRKLHLKQLKEGRFNRCQN